jgi:uncharacterized protein
MGQLRVRVQPKASRNAIEKSASGLKVWVSAPPNDGQANRAVEELVAKELGVAKSWVRVIRGETSREKVLEVEGVSAADLASWLEA